MFSSEQRLIINGEGTRDLQKALKFILDYADTTVKSFYYDEHGWLVFCNWYAEGKGEQKYPFEVTVPILVEQIEQYLKNPPKQAIELMGYAQDIDGSIYEGWELFAADWRSNSPEEIEPYELNALFAVRPAWIYYAK